jgi:dolichol-phosphate mannosyltransferase
MSTFKVSIVIPAYKEGDNILPLSKEIDLVMKKANYNYEIIIVDDNSDDGTIEVVDKIKNLYNITLKVRLNERGLSSAVIDGFKIASGDIYVVMDGDLSHPPEKIVELIDAIKNKNHEFVIGSRFVKGGSMPHFNFYRKINAWISKMLARPFTKVTDPMAGFFAFPSKILKSYDNLSPLGFKIGLELIVKCKPSSITEIPIVFQERLHGESKLSIKEQINYLIHLKRLFEYKYQSLAEFIKFSLIGGSGMVIDLLFVFISKEAFSLSFRIARIIGFLFALTSNFLLNRKFTFEHAHKGNIFQQYAGFFTISLIGFVINWFISVYLYEHYHFFNLHYLIASVLGVLGGLIINFTGSKFLVFKHKQ